MKRTPALASPNLSDPSKYTFQWSRKASGAGCWISIYSAMKSASACDFIAFRGEKSIFRAPSSTAHFDMHPVASLLHKMSPRWKFVTIACGLRSGAVACGKWSRGCRVVFIHADIVFLILSKLHWWSILAVVPCIHALLLPFLSWLLHWPP
jgi:hypothetical protein